MRLAIVGLAVLLLSTEAAAQAPVANAGPDQTVAVGALVHLTGSGSTDPNGIPLTFSWSLTTRPSGSTAVLSSATTVNPTFVADMAGTYVARLIVNNGLLSSAPDTVTITSTTPQPPVANAGPDQTVAVGALVHLTGSGSTDPNGFPLTFSWSLITRPSGSTAVLSSGTTVNPTFVADMTGTYVARLIVNNGVLSSAPDTVTITSTTPQAPVANAGPDQTVNVGALVHLTGSASTDPNGFPLTFSWSLTTRPSGSTAVLSSATTVNPTFVADLAGTYVARLIVNNGFLSSAPDTVTITAGTTPVFQSAVSRKVHGGAGAFDLPLSLTATNPTIEPRIGPAQTIVFTFDKAIIAATATITEGAATATPTFTGNDVIVALTGVIDQQYVTISLTNVASADGGAGGSGSVRIGFLLGDVNQNRVVTVADLGLVNAQLAQQVTATNYLKDVNASGTLSLADKGITNANLTKALPAP